MPLCESVPAFEVHFPSYHHFEITYVCPQIAGESESMKGAADKAKTIVDSGKALATLNDFVRVTAASGSTGK